jgi:chromosome segregation ATPase
VSNDEMLNAFRSLLREELQPVKEDLKQLNEKVANVELRQDGMKQKMTSLLKNQETTNAKLEALTMDVHRLEGNLHRVEEKVEQNHTEVMERLSALERDIENPRSK